MFKKKRNIYTAIAAACFLALAACSNQGEETGERTEKAEAEKQTEAADEDYRTEEIQETKEEEDGENTEKDGDILGNPVSRSVYMLEHSQPDEKGNRLVSEYGLSLALRMLADGTDGKTREGIQSWTGPEEDYTDLADGAASLANMFLLRNDHKNVEMKKDYKKILKKKYEAKEIIFSQGEGKKAAKQANGFIEKSTNGMIRDFFQADMLDSGDYLSSLVNILYFQAEWEDEMEKVDEYEFTSSDGEVIKVEGMKDEELTYVKNKAAQGFIKPYKGEDENSHRYSFYGLLPNEPLNIEEIFQLDIENLSQDGNVELTVTMPEFEFETDSIFNDMLKEAGIKDIFDGTGDFSKGFSYEEGNNVKVSKVRQKAKIKVDKLGTEAAAVTSIEMETTSAMPVEKEKIRLDFNRPFLFMIYDETINRPLFMGIVENPGK